MDRLTSHRHAAVLLVLLMFAVEARAQTVFQLHAVQLPEDPPITAFTFLAPQGWKVNGDMKRTPVELRSMFTLTDLEVTAPDGRSAHFYPSMSFTYSQLTQAQPMQPMDGGFFLPPPRSIGQWILYMAQLSPDPTVTDLKLVSEEPMPRWTQMLQQLYGAQLRDLAQMQHAPGGASFGSIQADRVVFTYKKNGQPMEETFVVGWRTMGMTVHGQVAMCQWGIIDMRSLAGPAGSNYLNDPALATINQSIRFTPQYFEAMHRYYTRMFRRPPAKTPAQMTTESQSVGDILHEGWKKRSGMQDEGQARMVDMIHERTPYNTPDGQTVHLSSHYQRVFSNGQNQYILTNDANWDPRIDPIYNQGNWQPLPPARQ